MDTKRGPGRPPRGTARPPSGADSSATSAPALRPPSQGPVTGPMPVFAAGGASSGGLATVNGSGVASLSSRAALDRELHRAGAPSTSSSGASAGGAGGAAAAAAAAASSSSSTATPSSSMFGASMSGDYLPMSRSAGGSGFHQVHPAYDAAPIDDDARSITRTNLANIAHQIDPYERLDDDVQELLLDMADEFIESVASFACRLARHRQSNTLDVKDVASHLERNWNINVPGYNATDYGN
ncbi:hypothetical protein CAOG_03397 [Capsaspora owczarzaki ATCC 30864]|uniref:Transcription initiation factor TFIID subunit 12 domain-containing protein n=1 Tax=Capsaspora owczarzaki (strain ATCC 30864) TaxID=595528 RepID=A0A0D2WN17_CAPO3|nr:hypothetical protein CAOG_03397 [Capsaspora owczarzaki ATCC 30864]KJE92420.1 hypothetical protein CAOG_003397 [Capsaspora owczarzaki ATCC 30864]|eukprot:XP_004364236.1 hypothetical protein CAOG_03397 [Capsaspora owczarzaki ATCC 30864]